MVTRFRMQIPDRFFTFLSIIERGILGWFIRMFYTDTGRFSQLLNDWRRFVSDPADTRIRIRSNPEIRIRVPNHFWSRQLKFKRSGALGVGRGMLSMSSSCFTVFWDLSRNRLQRVVLHVWSCVECWKAARILEHTLLVVFVYRSSAGGQKYSQHSDKDDESVQLHGQRSRTNLC